MVKRKHLCHCFLGPPGFPMETPLGAIA